MIHITEPTEQYQVFLGSCLSLWKLVDSLIFTREIPDSF